jgi:hypothetical protein
MGFMDKAKQLAEQAQQKLEETQKQFNDSQAAKAGQQQGGTPEGGVPEAGVRYDEHGRPVPQEGAPTGAPGGSPAQASPADDSDANANPDPFKPIE